jgi:hypothetical protein
VTVNAIEWQTEEFERHRPHLRAVAYRMLGSLSDADDIVQEAWLRLSRSDGASVQNMRGWLTTIVAGLSLDELRSPWSWTASVARSSLPPGGCSRREAHAEHRLDLGEPAAFPAYSTIGPPKSISSFLNQGDAAQELCALVRLVADGSLSVELGWRGRGRGSPRRSTCSADGG